MELDRAGRDELHYAAKKNDVDEVKNRLAAGVDINLQEYRAGLTPLHLAVQDGAVAAATALLDAGADIHARATSGFTPLHVAATRWEQSPDGSMMRLLLNRGADPAARAHNGKTPADLADEKFRFPSELKGLLT